MNLKTSYSDEFLNAYLDGELAEEDRERLLADAASNDVLKARLARLHKTRQLLRGAYQDLPTPGALPAPRRRPFDHATIATLLVAGVAVLAITFGLGWASHSASRPYNTLVDIAQTVQHNTADANAVRLLLHVTTGDAKKLSTVLEETELLLQEYGDRSADVQVQILTNGAGLNLVRADVSPVAAQVRALKQRYGNVNFLACKNAIERLQRERHLHVKLLPEAQEVPSALGEIIRRQTQGWTYVRI